MADTRTSPPALSMGNSPTIINTLPRWAYIALGIACLPVGAWASFITLQYFEHGAKALESDISLQALAVMAATMFVVSEMAAFTMAALMTEQQLFARRWMLTLFAGAVMLLEVCTIVAVQLALTAGAAMNQTTTTEQERDLRARIATIEASASAKRATADKQRLGARDAYELRLSAKSNESATAELAKTESLYAELAKVQANKRPTLVGLLGEKMALIYAVSRGVLISIGGLVFFGTAGALFRFARSASNKSRSNETANKPATIAPAPASFKVAESVAPKDYSSGLAYSSKMTLAGAGALAAMAAPVAHAAPVNAPVGALEQSRSGASEQSHFSEAKKPAMNSLGTTEMPGKSETEQAHSGATEQAHPASPSAGKTDAPKRAWTATAVPDGDKLDSAVSGKGATRYNRIKTAIRAGKLKPSMRAIQAAEGGGGIVVRRYLQQLETEGVIIKAGRGYVLANSKGGAA